MQTSLLLSLAMVVVLAAVCCNAAAGDRKAPKAPGTGKPQAPSSRTPNGDGDVNGTKKPKATGKPLKSTNKPSSRVPKTNQTEGAAVGGSKKPNATGKPLKATNKPSSRVPKTDGNGDVNGAKKPNATGKPLKATNKPSSRVPKSDQTRVPKAN
jgi:hypothetical protein